MRNNLLCGLVCLFISQTTLTQNAHAQIEKNALGYYLDAFRFSRTTSVVGSSRIQALGGAQTAVAGDIANITGNPAGLGAFRKNTVSIGFGAGNAGTNTSYFTQKENPNADLKGGKGLANLNHLAAAINLRPDESETNLWRGATFGFSLTRANNFQDQFASKGFNNRNSKTDTYVDRAWNIPEAHFQNTTQYNTGEVNYLRPAYYGFLLGVDANNPGYFTYFRNLNERIIDKINQENTVETRGGQYQWNFAFGGNLADKFFFGFSAGMTTINYRRYGIYRESMENPSSLLRNFTEYDSLRVTGSGINFTAGVMARPIKFLRIGASFTAPTAISMQESFGSTFESLSSAPNGTTPKKYKESAAAGTYTYKVRTPVRLQGGLTVLIPNLAVDDGYLGFITAEVEYMAYSSMNLKDFEDPALFLADNTTIRNVYKNVLNLRFGAEFMYENFYARGGFAYQPDPMKDIDFIDRSLRQITGGLGVRFKAFVFDFSLTHTRQQDGYQPYSMNLTSAYKDRLAGLGVNIGESPYSEIKRSIIQGVLSLTFQF